MQDLTATQYTLALQNPRLHPMGDWNEVDRLRPSHLEFKKVSPQHWRAQFSFDGYCNQMLSNGNLNISSTSSAVIRMKQTDTANPLLDKLFTNQQNHTTHTARAIENTSHGMDFSQGLSGIASGGFSSCAFQATWAQKGDDHYLIVSHIQSYSPLKSLLDAYGLSVEHVTKVLNIINPNVESQTAQTMDTQFNEMDKRALEAKSVYWAKYQNLFPGGVYGGFAFDRVVISFLPKNLNHKIWLACAEGPLGAVVTSVLACPHAMDTYNRRLFQQANLQAVDNAELQQQILMGAYGDKARILENAIVAGSTHGLQVGQSSLLDALAQALIRGDGATWQQRLGGNRSQTCFYVSEDNPDY